MLKPERMARTVIVGALDGIDAAIECLYELGALHLIDFTQPDNDFKLGHPLPAASTASQRLLKLRSMVRSLELEGHKPAERLPIPEIESKMEQALVTLDLNTAAKAESRQKIQSLIREKETEIDAISPFESFGIPIEEYEGYETISVITGACSSDPQNDISSSLKDFEFFEEPRQGAFTVALFVRSEYKADAAKVLSSHGFQELKLPKLKGTPKDIIVKNSAEVATLNKDLARVEKDLESIRKRFADLIIASEEHLSIEVLKAETPLRIAESANSFVIDGWVPESVAVSLKDRLEKDSCGKTYVETIRAAKDEEPPTKLMHSLAIRPYEFFINLVSTPKYTELDPTAVIFVVFPLFFGFMLGDLGLGLGLMALGLFMRLKLKSSRDLMRLGTIVLVAGMISSIFGLFVYCEAFGVPFHPPVDNPGEASWENVANIPLSPLINKLVDVKEMLALSIVAGWIHLTLGLLFGVVNNRHNPKHAFGKLAWLLILFGIFEEIMAVAGNASQTSKFFNGTLFTAIPSTTLSVIGIKVSSTALGVAVAGILALPFTEGAIAMSEILSVFANLVSYARLAALGVGHGAMGLAFNSMLFPLMFGPNIIIAVLGWITLVFAVMFFVFFLGSLSIGIQAIRLNYVEFFLKFFEGGGKDFAPLEYSRKFSVAE